jgi:hypothetical protein
MDDIAVNARMAWMCMGISAISPAQSETGKEPKHQSSDNS